MPTESKSPHRAVTKDIIDRIDSALEATQGHRAHAGKILGLDEKRVNNIVLQTPALRIKWSARAHHPPEGIVSEIERAVGLQPFSREDLAVVRALESQESILARGWEQLNFTEDKHAFLMAVQNEHGKHWADLGTMFKGGVVYTATELLYRFNKLMKLIDDIDEHPEKYERTVTTQFGENTTKTAHEHRLEVIDRALAIGEMFRKLNTDIDRAKLMAAQIERMKTDSLTDTSKKKAGWGSAPVEVTSTPV